MVENEGIFSYHVYCLKRYRPCCFAFYLQFVMVLCILCSCTENMLLNVSHAH